MEPLSNGKHIWQSRFYQKETIMKFCHFDYRNYRLFSYICILFRSYWGYWGHMKISCIQNGHHYVNIIYDSSNSVYLWKNRANRKWILHPNAKQNELRVVESVPHYRPAKWEIAKIDNDGIYGPYNKLYRNLDCFGKI